MSKFASDNGIEVFAGQMVVTHFQQSAFICRAKKLAQGQKVNRGR
jgi:hypothetical protein